MRLFLAALILSLASPTLADVASKTTGPSLTVGGTFGSRTFTDLTNLIILQCGFTTTNNVCTFRRGTASAGYTPSGSKVFKVMAYTVSAATANNCGIFNFGYADNDRGFGTATAATNAVFMSGDSTNYAAGFSAATIGSTISGVLQFTLPNAKYLFMTTGSSSCTGNAQVFGYEQ